MNQIFYQTKTKFTNTGDILINKELIALLREFGSLHANCDSNIPESFIRELGIREDEKITSTGKFSFPIAIIKSAIASYLKKDKVYLFSGLGDSHGGNLKSVLTNYFAGIVMLFYRCLGIRTVRIGRSFGKLTPAMEKSEHFRSLFISDYYVRDSKSLAYCKKMNIGKAKICPDMSWLLVHEDIAKDDECVIVFSMKQSSYGERNATYEEVLLSQCKNVVVAICQAYKKKCRIYITYQVREDKDFSERLYHYFIDNGILAELINEQLNLESAKEYYSLATYHISNRMHSLLLGYKYGSLPIAILETDKHIKISATFFDNNLDDLIIDTYDNDSVAKIAQIIHKRDEIMKKLLNCEKTNADRIRAVISDIIS